MSNIDFIQNLSKDLKPVQPLKSYSRRLIELLMICALLTIAGVVLWYFRIGEYHIPSGRSLAEALFLIISASVFTFFAVRSVSPHHSSRQLSKWGHVPLVAWTLIVLTGFIRLYLDQPSEALIALNYKTWLCPAVTLSIALPVSLASFVYLNRGLIHFPVSTFVYWSALSMAFGTIGLSFVCPWEDPLHELLWHVLPVFMAIPFVTALTTLIFRFWNTSKKQRSF